MRSILALACSLACALLFIPLGLTATPHPAAAAGPLTNTVYLPNITKMLGGGDGWQTPFIVQNVGSVATDPTMDFFSFADGGLVQTRCRPRPRAAPAARRPPIGRPSRASWRASSPR